MNKRIDAVLNEAKGPTVLDLGAVQHDYEKSHSDDWLHDHLCKSFDRVVGVDINCNAVQKLQDDGYDMHCGDVTALQLDIRADTVVAGELIEHVDNPGLMLDRVRQHLKPDGRLVLTTPNPWGWIYLVRLTTGLMHINDEHVAWYGPTVMQQLLNRHGFELVSKQLVQRERAGVMKWAQRLGVTPINGTTWVFTAKA